MITLNAINPNNLLFDRGYNKLITEYFPLFKKYMNYSEFYNSKYEWFYITDDSFAYEEARDTWIGMICVTEDKFIKGGNLHLSIFEVAQPIRGLSIGTRIIDALIDIARKNGYKTLSLQLLEPELIKFYIRFGFVYEKVGGKDVYVLYL